MLKETALDFGAVSSESKDASRHVKHIRNLHVLKKKTAALIIIMLESRILVDKSMLDPFLLELAGRENANLSPPDEQEYGLLCLCRPIGLSDKHETAFHQSI